VPILWGPAWSSWQWLQRYTDIPDPFRPNLFQPLVGRAQEFKKNAGFEKSNAPSTGAVALFSVEIDARHVNMNQHRAS
jgi:hypothetical protein